MGRRYLVGFIAVGHVQHVICACPSDLVRADVGSPHASAPRCQRPLHQATPACPPHTCAEVRRRCRERLHGDASAHRCMCAGTVGAWPTNHTKCYKGSIRLGQPANVRGRMYMTQRGCLLRVGRLRRLPMKGPGTIRSWAKKLTWRVPACLPAPDTYIVHTHARLHPIHT